MDRQTNMRSSAFASLAIGCAALLASQPAMAHPHVWVGTKSVFVFDNGALTGLRYTWLFDEMYSASAIDGLDKNNDGKLDAAELEELTKVNIDGLKEFDYFTSASAGGQAVTFDTPKNYKMELLEVDEGPGPQLVAGLSNPSAPAAKPETPQSAQGFWSRIGGWFSRFFGPASPNSPPSNTPSATTSSTGPAVASDKVKVLALHMTLPLKAPIPADRLTAALKGFQFVLTDAQMYIWFEPMPNDGISLSPDAPAGCRHTVLDPEQDEEQKKLAEAFGRAGSMSVTMPGRAVMLTCETR